MTLNEAQRRLEKDVLRSSKPYRRAQLAAWKDRRTVAGDVQNWLRFYKPEICRMVCSSIGSIPRWTLLEQ
jgi:hypothetical protein